MPQQFEIGFSPEELLTKFFNHLFGPRGTAKAVKKKHKPSGAVKGSKPKKYHKKK